MSSTKQKSQLGLLQIYTGHGKGKTTASMGLALRAWGRGKRVLIIQFIKNWETGERIALKRIGEGIEFHTLGKGFVGIMDDKLPRAEHERAAKEALLFAFEKAHSGNYDVVIFDEVNVAVNLNLLPVEQVLEKLSQRPEQVEIIFTGRDAHPELVKVADLVSHVEKVKHPFDKGYPARLGIEF